ncbi:MAG: BON domain-containing protein [Fimbriiglobus sp.]
MARSRRWTLACSAFLAVSLSVSAQTSTDTGAATSTTAGSSTPSAASVPPPDIRGASLAEATSSGGAVNPSNALGPFYANPLFQGRVGSNSTTAPGGFGTPLYGNAGLSTSTTNNTNAFSSTAAGRTTTAGNTGLGNTGRTTTGLGNTGNTGFGNTGRGGNTGFGNTGFGTMGGQQNQALVAQGRQIAFTATLSFKTQPISATQFESNLRGTLDRSTALSNPRGIEIRMDNGVVVLTGNVASEDEQRLAEGLLSLTPGVRQIRNELKVVPPVKP